MMKSVLLRWEPSLNDRSKLMGECTDLKGGCVTLVGPSLNPQSRFKKNSRATVPFKVPFCESTTYFSNGSKKSYVQMKIPSEIPTKMSKIDL